MAYPMAFNADDEEKADQAADAWIAAHPDIKILSRTRAMPLLRPLGDKMTKPTHRVEITFEMPDAYAGWVVELKTPVLGGGTPMLELWDAAIEDPTEAANVVRERAKAIDGVATARAPLSKASLDGLGLEVGKVAPRELDP